MQGPGIPGLRPCRTGHFAARQTAGRGMPHPYQNLSLCQKFPRKSYFHPPCSTPPPGGLSCWCCAPRWASWPATTGAYFTGWTPGALRRWPSPAFVWDWLCWRARRRCCCAGSKILPNGAPPAFCCAAYCLPLQIRRCRPPMRQTIICAPTRSRWAALTLTPRAATPRT